MQLKLNLQNRGPWFKLINGLYCLWNPYWARYSCFRCRGALGSIVKQHSTKYNEHFGCVVLCEVCWQQLGTPEARLPYYRELVDYQIAHRSEDIDPERNWPAIKAAVEAGE